MMTSSQTSQIVPSSSCISSSVGRRTTDSPSKNKQDPELQKAKQWTYYVETLKRTVDCLYEICRQEHSIIGCKEALMYLSSSVRDFESLIETINLEAAWETENKPHAVAWEVRKTMSPPGKPNVDGPGRDAEALINMLTLSPVVVQEVVRSAEEKLTAVSQYPLTAINESMDDKENQHKKTTSIDNQEPDADDGWSLVTTRNKRRKSSGGQSSTSSEKRPICSAPPVQNTPKSCPTMNVYERLASGVLRPPNPTSRPATLSAFAPGGAKLTCPRSAMDLPQTKASMAKMAYSRQLLWQKHQTLLEEKLLKRRRRGLQCARKTGSVPTLSAINFADPVAVARSAEAFKNRQKLQQALNADHKNANIMSPSTQRNIDCIEEMPTENEEERENMPAEVLLLGTPRDAVIYSRSEPPMSEYVTLPDGIDADEAWRAMTEEEESLVQEEQSLKKEIEEEESLSIDDELERQVAAEAAALEQMELDEEREKQKAVEEIEARRMKSAAATWQDIVNNWKQEMEEYASVSWSEIVEREITHYRKPGEFAQIHEKLSSPSRKRNLESATKKLEERQQRAKELRQMLQEEKARRLKELSNKVEEVRRKQAELFERKREHLEKRMEKAEENRQKNIVQIVKKARDDDIKVMEIQFINTMEASNMRHDVMARRHEWQQRVDTLAAERAKKNEEKAAKEAAAEERRKTAEIQRTERLREQAERKHARQLLVEAQRMEQERERAIVAKEKQRQHTERLAEKKAIQAAESEKLMKKIIQKQEETRRRHEETLSQVKQRALELSSPRPPESISSLADFSQLPSDMPYVNSVEGVVGSSTNKKCSLCNAKLKSDLSLMAHMLSEEHLARKNIDISEVSYENLKADLEIYVTDGDVQTIEEVEKRNDGGERTKQSAAVKKRRLRLRQKLMAKSKEFESLINQNQAAEIQGPFAIKTGADRSVREILRLVRGTIGEEKLMEHCNGIVKEGCSSKPFADGDVRALERAISELHRTLSSADTVQKRDDMLKCVWRSGLLDILNALVSCASNGDTLVPSRTFCKTLLLMNHLVSSDNAIGARLFFSNNILVLLDSFSVKLKVLLSQAANGEGVSSEATNQLAECFLLSALLSTFFRTVYAKRGEINSPTGKDCDVDCILRDDGSRLKMLLSFLVLCGFGESLTLLVQQCGRNISLPWTIKLDNNDHVLPFCGIIDLICACDEALSNMNSVKGTREGSPDSLEGTTTDKNVSLIASVVPNALRELLSRTYSLLTSETCASVSDSSAPSNTSHREDVNAFHVLASSLATLFCILSRREPNEAKLCIRDAEFSIRLVHIFAHCFALVDSSFHPSSTLCCSSDCSTHSHAFFRQLIFAAGYFASLGTRAQTLCLLGWQRSLVMQLCMLPLRYFSNRVLMCELIPTLIAICYQNKFAIDLIKQTLSPRVLAEFLKVC
uniref:C2H2-type domain-containing protein n=1 Tax=Parascaris univalens TaxID=6257 RepID=A0A915C975_PARUN